MKMKIYAMLLVMLVLPTAALSQTAVTGTIVDPNGNPYANGTASAQRVVATGINSGVPVNVSTNASGAFLMTLSPATYTFTICAPPTLLGQPVTNPTPRQVCFISGPIVISGGSQDVSSAVNSLALLLGPPVTVNIAGNAATATALQSVPTQCTPPQVTQGIAANGNSNCVTPITGAQGSAGQAQINNPSSPGAIGATGCQTFPDSTVGPINQDCEVHMKGPNWGVDITRFSSRSVNVNIAPQRPGITAAINSSSTSATISSASTFQNGDGVTIYGAGVTCPLTTPAAPTVTTVNDAGGLGTGYTVAGVTSGSTTYSYAVVPVSTGFCFPVASAVGSVTTAPSSIGAQSVALTGCSRSTTVATCTTSVPHQITASTKVLIYQSSDDTNLGSWVTVDTVPDTTHFTFTNGIDSTNGVGTSSTGGTVKYWTGIHIVTPTVSGAWEYCFYRTSSPAAFLGCGRPQSVFISDLTFEDWGTTITANYTRPSWLPSTPPVVAQANALVTTIASGAGTTTLTLASTASTSVVGSTIIFDNAPTISAAATSAQAAGAPILIPYGSYVINSFLTLPTRLAVMQEGSLLLNATVQVTGPTNWMGGQIPSSQSSPSFAQNGATPIIIQEANPGIYSFNGGGEWFEGLAFSGATNGSNLMFMDSVSPVTIRNSTFVTGTTANDLIGIGLIIRATNGAGNAQFYTLSDNLFAGGPGSFLNGSTDAPQLYCQICGELRMDNLNLATRSIVVVPANTSSDTTLMAGRDQGGIMPVLTLFNPVLGVIPNANVIINMFQEDTMAHPMLSVLGATAPNSNVMIINAGTPSGNGVSSPGLVSGRPITSLTIPIIPQGFVGQNVATYTKSSLGLNFTNGSMQVNGVTGSIGYSLNNNAAPTCAVSAGGSVPVGTWNYGIFAIDANGSFSALSPTVQCVTTSGQQTVTITPPARPTGAVTYQAFRNNGGGNGVVNVVPTRWTANIVDTFGFTNGGPTNLGFGLQAGINQSNMQAPQWVMTGGGFKNVHTGVFTADRATVWPDVGGNVQIATGTFTTGTLLKYDSSGRAIDSTIAATTIPTVYNHSGTQQIAPHIIIDSGALVAGTLTVTLTGSAVYTNSTSYVCTADDSTGINGMDVTYASGSSVTFNGTGTDSFRYMCIGN